MRDAERETIEAVGVAMKMSIEELEEQARILRRDIITCTTIAGSGHPSSSLSGVEIMAALYFGGIMQYNPAEPQWQDRDRFIMSKGHASPLLYVVLAHAGYFSTNMLATLRQIESPLEGHPNMSRLPGVEASTGSLGQGLSLGLGHAFAARIEKRDFHVFVILGDGEQDEGQIWEAAMTAAHYNLDNVTAIVDHNKAQQTGWVRDVLDYSPLAEKWRAFQWDVQEIDGHNMETVATALQRAKATLGRPSCIIAHTVKGKGVSFVEADYSYHGKALTKEEEQRALEELGWQ